MVEALRQSVLDRILVLRSLDNFASMDDDAASWMAEQGRLLRWAKGEVLSEEGDALTHVHIVVSGSLRTVRGPRVVDVVRGFGVGFLSVFARDEVGVRAEATEPTTTFELPVDTLLAAYEENFSLRLGALRRLSRSLLSWRGDLPRRADAGVEPNIGAKSDRPLTLVERILHLRETGLFQRVNLDAVIDVARRQEQVSIPAGTRVWNVGDPPDFSLRVVYGILRCTEPSGASVDVGTEVVLGAMDCLSDLPRRYNVDTVTEVQAFRLDQNPFLSVLESHPKVGSDLSALLAKGLLELS